MKRNELPSTLQEAARYFSDDLTCIKFVASLRWSDGEPNCPNCGGERNTFLSTRKIWKCKSCKKQFSVKVNTIFEDSPLGLDKWLMAIWLIANAKNGISSYELHRALGVTQKSAWFMLHRIRIAMKAGTFEKLSGTVEVDETYVGGDGRNMHLKKRRELNMKAGQPKHKTAVLGMIQRGGKVRAKVIDRTDKEFLSAELKKYVIEGSEVFTDQWGGYNDLRLRYIHDTINHAVEYVRDNVHTNSIENFWSLLKRTVKGTYVSVAPEHLQAYVEEQAFRYNERKGNDQSRFVSLIESISGKRLTYAQLIGYQTIR